MRVLRAVRATPLRGARFVALEGARLPALRRAPLVLCRAATALADDLVARTFATDATPAAASAAPAAATPATTATEEDSDSDEPTTPAMTKAEVSDAEIIFNTAWKNIESVRGRDKMIFPKEIMWLMGAPGAGKGTMSGIIMRERDLMHGPIEVSALLKHERFKAAKDSGTLVGDRDVVQALLEELLDPKYNAGVVVDGFPRTRIQAQCIRLLFEHMKHLYVEFGNHPELKNLFRRPMFRITVLYVEQEESVRRQLTRAKALEKENRRVQDTGLGTLREARATDLSDALARERYRVFKEEVYEAIRTIKDDFHFHLIDATPPVEVVRTHMMREFAYQSSLELDDQTFEHIRRILPAKVVVQHARQKMVQRLSSYMRDYPKLFDDVIDLIEAEFMHIIQRQALAGRATIRSANPLLNSAVALNMLLDVLSERGYFVTLDIRQERYPDRVEPSVPGDPAGQRIVLKTARSYLFTIEFPRPHIRRGD